ncbi:MAG: DUF2752 domain-containing protein [Deltaproteobacteria bacterium]|nr:DUF2752 domain-containing protein [Deltaproteobacteria bacterium]
MSSNSTEAAAAPSQAVAVAAAAAPAIDAEAARVAWEREAARSKLLSRVVWAVLGLGALTVVVIAAILHPSTEGHGTHTQLGLPPCGFLVVTGYPCPGCGLTTSFSAMAHFDPVLAAFANPFGVLLFLVTLAFVPISARGAWRGEAVLDTLERIGTPWWAAFLAVASISVWATKVLTLYLGR